MTTRARKPVVAPIRIHHSYRKVATANGRFKYYLAVGHVYSSPDSPELAVGHVYSGPDSPELFTPPRDLARRIAAWRKRVRVFNRKVDESNFYYFDGLLYKEDAKKFGSGDVVQNAKDLLDKVKAVDDVISQANNTLRYGMKATEKQVAEVELLKLQRNELMKEQRKLVNEFGKAFDDFDATAAERRAKKLTFLERQRIKDAQNLLKDHGYVVTKKRTANG